MRTSSLFVLWQSMLLLALSTPSISQPTLSFHQPNQNKRIARSPETFKDYFDPIESDEAGQFINSHGSPLMSRSNTGFNEDDIQPLLRQATDEELRLLHDQAKELRRQTLEKHENNIQKQLNRNKEVTDDTSNNESRLIFNPLQSEPFFEEDSRSFPIELFPEEFLSHQKKSPQPTVFSTPGRQSSFNDPRGTNRRVLLETEKPRIHFPSIKLKAEVPAVDLNSDLNRRSFFPSKTSPLKSDNQFAIDLFLDSRDSPSSVSTPAHFIPTSVPRAPVRTQPIFSSRDTLDHIPSQISGRLGSPSEKTLTLFESIQKRINERPEQRPIQTLHKDDSIGERFVQFPNFQRTDSLQDQTRSQQIRNDNIPNPSISREENIRKLQAIAGAQSSTRRPIDVRVDIDSENAEEEKKRKLAGEKRRKQLFGLERRRMLDSKRRRLSRTRIRPKHQKTNMKKTITERPKSTKSQIDSLSSFSKSTNSPIKSLSSFQVDAQMAEDVVVDNAIKAILNRAASGSVKNSPVVWAAIKTIYKFIETQEKPENNEVVPQNILMAIMQLTEFLDQGGNNEKVEAMESFNVETVNSFVKSKQNISVDEIKQFDSTLPKHTSTSRPILSNIRTSTLTTLAQKDSRRITTQRKTFDMYSDESITGNDYDFDYESGQDVQFKFRFKASSQIRTTQPAFQRGRVTNRNIFSQQSFTTQQTTTEKTTKRPEIFFSSENDGQFKLHFDPKSGLFSTSVEQFPTNLKKPTNSKNDGFNLETPAPPLRRPKFEIFTLPI